MVPVPPMSVGLHAPLLAPHSDSITNNPLQPRPGKYVGKHIFPSFSSFQFRFMLLPQSNPKLVLQLWTRVTVLWSWNTLAAPLQSAATIQELHFWPSNYNIKSI